MHYYFSLEISIFSDNENAARNKCCKKKKIFSISKCSKFIYFRVGACCALAKYTILINTNINIYNLWMEYITKIECR